MSLLFPHCYPVIRISVSSHPHSPLFPLSSVSFTAVFPSSPSTSFSRHSLHLIFPSPQSLLFPLNSFSPSFPDLFLISLRTYSPAFPSPLISPFFSLSQQLYREADLHEEKDRISRSLGATRDPNLIQRVLQFAISVSCRSDKSQGGLGF